MPKEQMQETDLSTLEARLAERERYSLARTAIVSIVPVIAAVLFLWITLAQISGAQRRLEETREQLSQAETELAAANQQIEELKALYETDVDRAQLLVDRSAQLENRVTGLEQRLAEVLNLEAQVYDPGWEELENLAGMFSPAGPLLDLMIAYRDQGVGWGPGNTPEGGFTSPGFAGSILQQMGRLPEGDPVSALGALEQSSGSPELGDLVVYDSGYTLFFFRDGAGTEFVVGMTPIGIASLPYTFGLQPLHVLRTGLNEIE